MPSSCGSGLSLCAFIFAMSQRQCSEPGLQFWDPVSLYSSVSRIIRRNQGNWDSRRDDNGRSNTGAYILRLFGNFSPHTPPLTMQAITLSPQIAFLGFAFASMYAGFIRLQKDSACVYCSARKTRSHRQTPRTDERIE